MKFAHRFLIMKIMRALLVPVAHLHQISGELGGFRTSMSKIHLEIAAVATHRFAQFCEFLQRFENVLELCRGEFLLVGKIFQPHILCAE